MPVPSNEAPLSSTAMRLPIYHPRSPAHVLSMPPRNLTVSLLRSCLWQVIQRLVLGNRSQDTHGALLLPVQGWLALPDEHRHPKDGHEHDQLLGDPECMHRLLAAIYIRPWAHRWPLGRVAVEPMHNQVISTISCPRLPCPQ